MVASMFGGRISQDVRLVRSETSEQVAHRIHIGHSHTVLTV
jgi:hypothetical protein